MFANHVDQDFNDFWDKIELDKTRGTYTELLAFSTMLDIDIYMIPHFLGHEEVGDLRGFPATSWPSFLGWG